MHLLLFLIIFGSGLLAAAARFEYKRFAVYALTLRRISLMCADVNFVKSTVVCGVAVVCTLVNGASDRFVCLIASHFCYLR